MTNPAQPFETFKKWPDSLRNSVDMLCGNPFSLLVLATMYTHQDESFTSTGLRKLFIGHVGTEDGVPQACSFLDAMKRLASGPNPLLSVVPRRGGLRTQISRRGQEHGAAYAGPVLQFCLDNTGVYPQEVLGYKINKATTSSSQSPKCSLRLGLYSLLSEVEGPLTSTEISKALGLEKVPGNNLIRPLGELGILDINRGITHPHEPFSVSLDPRYQESLPALASDVNALAVPGGGIVDGLDMAENVIKDSADFAYLLSLRQSQIVQRRRQE